MQAPGAGFGLGFRLVRHLEWGPSFGPTVRYLNQTKPLPFPIPNQSLHHHKLCYQYEGTIITTSCVIITTSQAIKMSRTILNRLFDWCRAHEAGTLHRVSPSNPHSHDLRR